MARPDLDRAIRIPIIGDYRPFEKDLKKSKGLVGKFGNAAMVGFKVATVAAVGFTAAIGASIVRVDKMRSTIGRATGLAGEDLDKLTESAIQLQGRVVQGADAIAGTVGAARTFFKGTNEEITSLSEAVLRFSHVSGGDAQTNTENLGKITELWGLNAATAKEELDALNHVSQEYGLSGDVLTKGLAKQGGAFANLGFSVGETAVLMGRMSDAGVDMRKQGPAIEAFLGRVVKAGGDPATALADLEAQIQGAGSGTDALRIATEAMGQSYGPRFAAAIRSGALTLAGISEEADGASGNLERTFEETLTLQDRWRMFTGSLRRELDERVFPHLATFVGWLQKGIDQVGKLDEWLDNLGSGPMAAIGVWVRSVWPTIVTEGRVIWYNIRQIAGVMWDLVDGPLRYITDFIRGYWESFAGSVRELISRVGSLHARFSRFVTRGLAGLKTWIDGTWDPWVAKVTAMGTPGSNNPFQKISDRIGEVFGGEETDDGTGGLTTSLAGLRAELDAWRSGEGAEGTGGAAKQVMQDLAAEGANFATAHTALAFTIVAGSIAGLARAAAPVLLNPVGLAIAGVAAAVGGFVLLYKNNPGFKDWVSGLWGSVTQAGVNLWEKMKTEFSSVRWISERWNETLKGEDGLNANASNFQRVMSLISGISVGDAISNVSADVSDLRSGLADFAFNRDWANDSPLDHFLATLAGIGTLPAAGFGLIHGLAGLVAGAFSGNVEATQNAMQLLADSLWDYGKALLAIPANVAATVVKLTFEMAVKIPGWIESIFNTLTPAAITTGRAFIEFLMRQFGGDEEAQDRAVAAFESVAAATATGTFGMPGFATMGGEGDRRPRGDPVPPRQGPVQPPPGGGGPTPPPVNPLERPLYALGFGATGAIVTRPTLSWVGEAGPEAVVPLSSMPGARPLPTGERVLQPIVLQLNGREFGRVIVDLAEAERRRGAPTDLAFGR